MTLQEKQIEVLKWADPQHVWEIFDDVYLNAPRPYEKKIGYRYPAHSGWILAPPLTLDWIHECIGKLEPKYWAKFLRELVIATKTEQENNSITAVMIQTNATAEQRLKALYEVITTSEGFALHSAAIQQS